jgi:hypothetical protein
MVFPTRVLSRAGGLVVGLLASLIAAQDPVLYDLRAGSTITDECQFCDRAPIVRAVTGSFTLGSAPAATPVQSYAVTGLEFRDAANEYVGTGTGTYALGADGAETAALTVEVNGVPAIELTAKTAAAAAVWPLIDIALKEPDPHDPAHVYTLHIVAAPRVAMVAYRLEEGSVLIDDCIVCGRATLPIPIAGTFLLGEVAGAPNPVSTFRIDAIDFKGTRSGVDYKVQGIGTYRQGGEVALLQHLFLDVQVNDAIGVHMESGPVPVEAVLPALDVQASQTNAPGIIVYSLRIVARPAGDPVPFRRGDANTDGSVNISDAVSILLWKFSGGKGPDCLDTADVNDDESHDITDAIFLLNFLFQGDRGPPDPGPDHCGTSPTPSVGCDSYDACEG